MSVAKRKFPSENKLNLSVAKKKPQGKEKLERARDATHRVRNTQTDGREKHGCSLPYMVYRGLL
ncbi:hypothetical protein A9986_14200 [Solibacillus silvestris]|nr:hypothetical protein A9986_14200 [Solibacillus silvestris]